MKIIISYYYNLKINNTIFFFLLFYVPSITLKNLFDDITTVKVLKPDSLLKVIVNPSGKSTRLLF